MVDSEVRVGDGDQGVEHSADDAPKLVAHRVNDRVMSMRASLAVAVAGSDSRRSRRYIFVRSNGEMDGDGFNVNRLAGSRS
jgi:hypothetical protein